MRARAVISLLVVALVVAACGEPSSAPPAAPTATASLEVPPLPPPTSSATAPLARNAPPPSSADADEAPLPRDAAAAEQAFQDAKREMTAGNLQKARELFLRSYRLDPAAGTLLNLAVVEEQLGLRDDAIRHYQAAYDDSMKNGRTDRAKMAKERLDRLKSRP